MPSQKQWEAMRRELCAEPDPDDGLDFRVSGRAHGGRNVIRDLRLCGEVARILSLELAEVLVDRVEPAPDTSRLRVWVHTDDLDAVLRRAAFLRAAVAAGIRRRRAPELVFAAVPR